MQRMIDIRPPDGDGFVWVNVARLGGMSGVNLGSADEPGVRALLEALDMPTEPEIRDPVEH